MSIILVTYDLKKPGRNYKPVHDYLKTYSYCKYLESVWLLDTHKSPDKIRNELKTKIDSNDTVFVVKLRQDWASYNYGCADWLNSSIRNWSFVSVP